MMAAVLFAVGIEMEADDSGCALIAEGRPAHCPYHARREKQHDSIVLA
jgi:hypothetical protein